MNTGIWLIRREFWENRAIWLIPAVIGALMIMASLFGGYRLFGGVDLATLRAVVQGGALDGMILIAATFFIVMSIYSTWYLLDCLYADRRDRSILFWKSLPISDTATVLCKLGTALIVIPLVYFLAADLTTLIVAFIISVRASSYIGSALWRGDLWLQLQALWLYFIITTAIWYLPVAAWLLVISAWAKRAVMLWSIFPPLALILAERLFLGTHVVAAALQRRIGDYMSVAFSGDTDRTAWVTTTIDDSTIQAPVSIWRFIDAGGFFTNPQTWIGAAIGAALVAVAIQLRLRRAET